MPSPSRHHARSGGRLSGGLVVLVLAGCGRGLLSHVPEATGGAIDAGTDPDALAPGKSGPIDTALIDGPPREAGPGGADATVGERPAPSDGPPPDGALPPVTTWEPCGQLSMASPRALVHMPDGKHLVVAYADGAFDVIGLDGAPELIADNDLGQPTHVAVSPDGTFFAGVSYHSVSVWRTDRQKFFIETGPYGRMVEFSKRQPGLVLTTSEAASDNVRVWRVDSMGTAGFVVQPVARFTGSPDAAFAPDGSSLLLVEAGARLVASDFTGQNRRPQTLKLAIADPVFSSDATLLAGRTADGQLAVYRTSDGGLAATARLPGPIDRLLFLGTSMKVLALGGAAGHVFSIATGQWATVSLPAPLLDADPSPDGDSLAGVTDHGKVVRLRITDGQPLALPTIDIMSQGAPSVLATSRDGRLLAVGGGHNMVWDVRRNILITQLLAPPLAFEPDGQRVVLSDGVCRIVDLDDSQLQLLADCASSIAFSPDGRIEARSDRMGVHLTVDGVPRSLTSQGIFPGLRFSPDGSKLVSSANQLWSTTDWKSLWPPMPPDLPDGPAPDPIDSIGSDNTATFSPDGTSVLLSSSVRTPYAVPVPWQTTAKLRAVADGRLLHNFGATLERAPSFSPDGAWIAAGGSVVYAADDRMTVRLDPATTVSTFLPDGRIAAGEPDDRIILYCPRVP
jgi:WD40 repeat protein